MSLTNRCGTSSFIVEKQGYSYSPFFHVNAEADCSEGVSGGNSILTTF